MTKYLVETTSSDVKEELEKIGKVGSPKTLTNFFIIDTGKSEDDIKKIEGVLEVEEDSIDTLFNVQNSPKSWALPYMDGKDNYYNYSRTGKNVDIYIMDTGIRSDHADFTNRVETLFSFDTYEYSSTGIAPNHGTGCASCAAGHIFGVAKESNIFNVRYNLSRINGIKCLDTILDHHLNKGNNNPSILNMSFGAYSIILKDALIHLYNSGIVCVAAAGNDNSVRPNYPASNSFVISVMANDRRNNPSIFTNFGQGNDLFAPGTMVPMASINSKLKYTQASGTSFSAPYVSGILAMMLQGSIIHSASGVEKIKQLLLSNCWTDFLNLRGKYRNCPNRVANTNIDNDPIIDKHIFSVTSIGNYIGQTQKQISEGDVTKYKFDSNKYMVSGNNPGGYWEDNIFITNPITFDSHFVFTKG